jgi:hypothetical protein
MLSLYSAKDPIQTTYIDSPAVNQVLEERRRILKLPQFVARPPVMFAVGFVREIV